jgi:polyribonucleotide nucleotidyltransferase
MQKTIEIEAGSSIIKIETNRWAKQSNGSALVSYKDNIILVTANMKDEVKETQDFLPLMVDFRENTYSAGKIPGGFFKREGKPSEKEVLLSRLIDRPIRPLFAENHFNETQIIAFLLSADFSIDYDALGIIGASAALLSSTIPFFTPVGAVKIGWKNDEFLINPGQNVARDLDMVLLAVGTEKDIVMMEAGGNEFSEELAVEGIRRAKEIITRICQAQKELINPDKIRTTENSEIKRVAGEIKNRYADRVRDAIFTQDRMERDKKLKAVTEEMTRGKDDEKELALYKNAFHHVEAEIFRTTLLKEKRRTDNRTSEEIRAISIELGILPRVHGSAVFTRGETQALATVTLGSEDDAQRLDNLNGDESHKKFMLHYNFPPFSVGEVSFLRGAGRREIGHGNLAEKAVGRIIPSEERFPYTIRVVSDILESNGSSSMATVCGATLALMNAGVPIKAPVAGIAMGLVKEADDYMILTDIAGYEDHFGDMDFKVAGTEKGITAVQLDIKIDGLSDEIITHTLAQAKKARLFILDKMKNAISAPAEKLSEYAPVITTMQINVEKIKDLIGPGGKTIKELVATYSVKINADADGKVSIAAANHEVAEKVMAKIEALTGSPEIDKIYHGKITRIEDYGLFVEIMPGTTGLLHISEVSRERVRDIRTMFRIGETIDVKVLSVERDGKMKLSKKAADASESNGQN